MERIIPFARGIHLFFRHQIKKLPRIAVFVWFPIGVKLLYIYQKRKKEKKKGKKKEWNIELTYPS
jgi:hypothetical protein